MIQSDAGTGVYGMGTMAKGRGKASRRFYEPDKYWEQRAWSYVPASREAELASMSNVIKSVNPRSILDVGSGVGDALISLRERGVEARYRMVDFSDGMRERCYSRTGIWPDKWNGKSLPYTNNSFELVLSLHVMLHVPGDSIRDFIEEHIRVSSRFLYIGTNTHRKHNLAIHCFYHDYRALINELGLKILNWNEFNNGVTHFLLERSRD